MKEFCNAFDGAATLLINVMCILARVDKASQPITSVSLAEICKLLSYQIKFKAGLKNQQQLKQEASNNSDLIIFIFKSLMCLGRYSQNKTQTTRIRGKKKKKKKKTTNNLGLLKLLLLLQMTNVSLMYPIEM